MARRSTPRLALADAAFVYGSSRWPALAPPPGCCMLRDVWIQIVVAWLSASLGLWASSKLLDGVSLRTDMDVLWAGALLGVLQWMLTGPLFVALGIGTLGIGFLLFFITRWVASALIVMLTAKLSSRLTVSGFWPALATAFVVSLAGSVVRWLV